MSHDDVLTASAPHTGHTDLMASALSTLLALFIVLGLIVLSLKWLQRRYLSQGQVSIKPIVISTTPIGPKERIVCLKYRETEYMLGIGGQQITVIGQWAQPLDSPPPPEATPAPSARPSKTGPPHTDQHAAR